MKLPAYPKYKPSGVEWLGNVPEKWEVKRLKYIAGCGDVKVEADLEAPLPYIGLEQIESWTGKILPLDLELVPSGIANRFKKGNVLFGKLRPYLAKACTPDFTGLCSTELLVFDSPKQDSQFLRYTLLTHGFISLVDSAAYGVKMPRASWDFIGICNLLVPPPDEQRAIADFLEARTAKIDALLTKRRALIEKLKEKRTALISRTVTRGLNPNAKLKPSGIEWLGDLPEHWQIDKHARRFRSAMGNTILKEDLVDDGKVPVYSATESGAIFGYVDNPNVELFAGDIVIPARGISIGFPMLIKERSTSTQTTIYSKLLDRRNIHSPFVHYVMIGHRESLFYFDRTAIPQITVQQVSSNPLPIPPKEEQIAIADFLDRETAKIDRMVEKVELAIARLQEYRTALITAAVTGKIDVRPLKR